MTRPASTDCAPFILGGNYPWREFFGDFGGYNAFGGGRNIASNLAEVTADLTDMRANGLDVVRVWLFPDMASDGLTWQGNCISAVGGTIRADVEAFSAAAAAAGVRILWTYISFDGYKSAAFQGLPAFRPTLAQSTIDPTCRAAFMSKFVATISRYIRDDPNRPATYWATDLINEPDWVIHDPANGWTQAADLDHAPGAIDYPAMRLFLQQMADTVRATDPAACITIGTAGMKWATEWEGIADINTPHSYAWNQAAFPTDQPPTAYDLTKPTYYGEYPHAGYPDRAGSFPGAVAGSLPKTHTDWLCEAQAAGYRGAFGWAYRITDGAGWTAATLEAVRNFAAESVHNLAALDIEPATVPCGTTVGVTVRPVNPKGTPRGPIKFTNNGSVGLFSGLVYDPEKCEYTGQYTAPACASGSGSIVSLSAADELGNTASGTLEITTGTTIGVDSCIVGAAVDVVTGDGSGCTQTVQTLGCDNTTGSGCCPAEPIPFDDNPACPDRGDYVRYQLSGCESCGGYRVEFEEGYEMPPYEIGGGVLCFGPLSSSAPFCFYLSCNNNQANEPNCGT